MKDQNSLIKSKRFLPLFITQFLGAFNDNAFKNAFLIWFTYDVANYNNLNAPIMVTLAAGLFILPFFLFSAIAGQVADKYEKSWLTGKIKQAEIILMVACALCFFSHNIYGLLVILFLMGVQSTFFGPIKYSLLPEHLRDNELIRANALIEGGTFLAILLGTIFGALIVRTEYGVEFLSFFVIIFAITGWVASLSIPKSSIGDPNLKISWNIVYQTKKIIGYAHKERAVWLSIIGISWFWLIGMTFLTQFPAYTKEIIGANEHVVTLFLAVFSTGIAIGSALCNKLIKGEINGRFVPFGCIGMGVSILSFVVMSISYMVAYSHYHEQVLKYEDKVLTLLQFFDVGISSFAIVVSLLMIAICAGIYIVPLYAIMQHRSDKRYLARIIAANNVMNALFMVVATILALVMFSLKLTVIEIFLTIGIVNILIFFMIRRGFLKRLNHA